MDIESNGGNKRVFHRLGNKQPQHHQFQQQKVCFHWQAGRCTRNPCAFLHRELPPPPSSHHHHQSSSSSTSTSYNGASKRAHGLGGSGPKNDGFSSRKNPNFNNTWGRVGAGPPKKLERVCNYWVQGNCSYGDNCKFLHSWSIGGSFSLLTTLEGHQKVVTGITLPSGDKLYTGSKDENVRIWDCASGQCVNAIPLGGEIGCMISEGPWVFIGLPNMVKAWNIETVTDMSLSGPVGQVYSLVVGNDLLFAGTQDGSILAWKFNPATNCFEPAASLTGHTLAVVTMFVGANRLYSGSMDNSIRVWNLETLQCIQVLTEHTSVVMSVLCWEQFLLSASLDNTIKGILSLCGMFDSEAKPVVLCSTNDNFVHIYDLPSFMERGKIISKQEIRVVQAGPSGLFFTGDGNGQVRVWNWLTEPKKAM
ncbi:Zinc finger CCCH domain-containing protein 48 [Bienertia sinuspersici]